MTTKDQVATLLRDAGTRSALFLSCRGLRRVDAGGESLLNNLREMMKDEGRGVASGEIFESAVNDLGHASSWVDAGGVYENLLDQQPADYVFCLDPWAAQLLSGLGEAAGDAQWVLVADPDRQRTEEHPEYWRDLDRWLESLPWSMIIPRDLWDDAVGVKSRKVVFLVRYSGSFPHLKLFLESLARQQGSKELVSCLILAKEGDNEVDRYLKWVALAHPQLRIDCVVGGWESRMDSVLRELLNATLVLVDDHAVLHETFTRDAGSLEAPTSFHGALMASEVTAHLITGNLDPWANYERLAGETPAEHSAEIARVIPASAWREGDGNPSERIIQLAQEPLPLQDVPRRILLQLGDLR